MKPMNASAEHFSHLGDREVHQGHVWHLAVGSFAAPDGTEFERDIVRSPGSVGVVALVDADDADEPEVVLVEQYRPPYTEAVLEIPAGMRDVPGEAPELTAARELAEEAGLAAEHFTHLLDMYPSPGMTDAVCTIFLATGCTAVPTERHGPEEDHMEIHQIPFSEAVRMASSGEIHDAKTVAGLLIVAQRRSGGDATG